MSFRWIVAIGGRGISGWFFNPEIFPFFFGGQLLGGIFA